MPNPTMLDYINQQKGVIGISFEEYFVEKYVELFCLIVRKLVK